MTLVYSSHDEQHNNAVALKDYVWKKRTPPRRRSEAAWRRGQSRGPGITDYPGPFRHFAWTSPSGRFAGGRETRSTDGTASRIGGRSSSEGRADRARDTSTGSPRDAASDRHGHAVPSHDLDRRLSGPSIVDRLLGHVVDLREWYRLARRIDGWPPGCTVPRE